ncbi:ribbon-helix-helix domain-containing protein [Patescibacteria group bacterium]|nr:ribbon-helix-helix domain-containing protein [Patescibacteria group bacterium]
MNRNTVVINISAPPDIAEQISETAKNERRSKSELLRDAFLSYSFDKRLAKLQQTGQVLAQKLGLESYDQIEEYLEK